MTRLMADHRTRAEALAEGADETSPVASVYDRFTPDRTGSATNGTSASVAAISRPEVLPGHNTMSLSRRWRLGPRPTVTSRAAVRNGLRSEAVAKDDEKNAKGLPMTKKVMPCRKDVFGLSRISSIAASKDDPANELMSAPITSGPLQIVLSWMPESQAK